MSPPQPRPAPNRASQQLIGYLGELTACADRAEACQVGVERAAEAVKADLGAIVDVAEVLASTGFGADDAPGAELSVVAAGRLSVLRAPWGERCPCVVLELEGDGPTLVLARGAEAFDAQETTLLQGMASVLGQTLRMHDLRDAERQLREQGEQQVRQNEQLVESLRQRQQLLERLSHVQRSIVHRTPLGDVLEAVVQGTHELLGHDTTVLRLLEVDDSSVLSLVAVRGFQTDSLPRIQQVPVGEGAAGRAVAENRLVTIDDLREPGTMADPADATVRAAMAAPLHENGLVVGSLASATRVPGRRFSRGEMDVLLAFAENASLALTDAKNFDDAMHQAVHDSLTGLPNRSLFLDRLEHALARAPRTGKHPCILFMDLDNFKTINDGLGHAAGDHLLRAASSRLVSAIRPGDTAARFGGDEFAILLEDASGAHAAEQVAGRILEALSRPFFVLDTEVRTTASIGIVDGKGKADDLLRDADMAMYRAKAEGKGRYARFEPEMHTAMLDRVALSGALAHAVDNGEMQLRFQPIVELDGGTVTRLEALLRWEHPQRGLLDPAHFIPLAEETRAIVPLGRWVLAEACARAGDWRRRYGDCLSGGVTVNIAAEQLHDDDLAAAVQSALRAGRLEPSELTLEITESVLMSDPELTIERLARLKEIGVRVAIDDFGTGYSSLQYLRRFPLDELKIAAVFVADIDSAAGDITLPRAILELAERFSLEVVAEGIETERQRDALLAIGCDRGQGFLFHRALDAPAVEALLDAQDPLSVAAG